MARKTKKDAAGADDQTMENADLGEPGPDNPEGMRSIDRLPVNILSQYVKDLSFENPNAPMPLRKTEGKPDIKVDFNMDAKKIDIPEADNAYEVTLTITAHARKGDMTTFICEVVYGMAVNVGDVPQDKIHPLLLIEMPHYMFPFVRQIVADMTMAAGYLPFMLSPVNFKALYRQQFGGPQVKDHVKKQDEKEKEAAEA